jgi:hypothetical protein
MSKLQDTVNQYAKQHGCDIVQPSAERGGYHYFHLDYAGRQHYTGHPHIIKVSPKGKVQRVLDTDELYWAVARIKEPEQSS